MDEDGDQVLSNDEPPMRGLLFEGRTESINAATIFVNPNIVQPAVREQASLPVEQLPATFSRQQDGSGSHPLMSPTPSRPETIIGQEYVSYHLFNICLTTLENPGKTVAG